MINFFFLANSERSRGHNELDLPGITQPIMYEKIAQRKSVPEFYEHKLLVRLGLFFFSLFSSRVIWYVSSLKVLSPKKRCLPSERHADPTLRLHLQLYPVTLPLSLPPYLHPHPACKYNQSC